MTFGRHCLAKLIGLAGVQGSGKTTLLSALKARGIAVDDFKVSREVQKRLGWQSLEAAVFTPESMITFQRAIFDVKLERENQNAARTDVDIILTERSFADILAYTRLWAWSLANDRKWTLADGLKFVSAFSGDCFTAQKVYSGCMFLPLMDHIVWEEDPRRAKQTGACFIETELRLFLGRCEQQPQLEITTASVDNRVQQVEEWLESQFGQSNKEKK